MRVQRLHLLHVLGGHIQPQLGALLAVERRGDALLHVASGWTEAQRADFRCGRHTVYHAARRSTVQAARESRVRRTPGCSFDCQFLHLHKRHLIDSVCNYVGVTPVVWDEITVVRFSVYIYRVGR